MTYEEARLTFTMIVRTVIDAAQMFRITTDRTPDTIYISTENFRLASQATSILNEEPDDPQDGILVAGYLVLPDPTLAGSRVNAVLSGTTFTQGSIN